MMSLGIKPQGELFETNTAPTNCIPAGDMQGSPENGKQGSTGNGTLGATTSASPPSKPSQSAGGTIPGKLSALVSKIAQPSERADPATKPADPVYTASVDKPEEEAVDSQDPTPRQPSIKICDPLPLTADPETACQDPTEQKPAIKICNQLPLTADPETTCLSEKTGSSDTLGPPAKTFSVRDALLVGRDGNGPDASKHQCDQAPHQQEEMSTKAVAVENVVETDSDRKLASGSTKRTRKVRFKMENQFTDTTKNDSRDLERARPRSRPTSPTTFPKPAETSESAAIPVTTNVTTWRDTENVVTGVHANKASAPRHTTPTTRENQNTHPQPTSRQMSEAGRGRVGDSRASSYGHRSEGPRTGRWDSKPSSDYRYVSRSDPTSSTRGKSWDGRRREKKRNAPEEDPASRRSTCSYPSEGGEKQPWDSSYTRKRRNSFERGWEAERTSNSPPSKHKRRRRQHEDGDYHPYREDGSRPSSPDSRHGKQPGYEAVLSRSYGRYDETDGADNGRDQRGTSPTQQAPSNKPKSSYGDLASVPVQRVRSLQQQQRYY